MILYYYTITDENEADFAIFLTPDGGTFARLSNKALGFNSFWGEMALVPLWRLIRRGPACESLF